MEVVAAPSAGAVGSDGAASSAAASAELSRLIRRAPQPEVGAPRGRGRRRNFDNEGDGDDDEKEKSRGKYRCGRCGAPKAGHVCPLESRSVRR